MQKRNNRNRAMAVWCCSLLIILLVLPAAAQEQGVTAYVGEASCQPCHETQFDSFKKLAKKSRSFESVLIMAKGLPPEKIKDCYVCHTTGYGKPGGFISLEQTPELKNAGCEVCHGPGKLHVQTQNPDHIRRKVTVEVCQECHIEDRVRSFHYKPKLHAGSH
ncbi:multiheme c-type cytochrome [Thermodesulfobacteriota bacterium]